MIIVIMREEVSVAHYFCKTMTFKDQHQPADYFCSAQEESSIVRSGCGLTTHQQTRQRRGSLNAPA